MSPEQMQPEIGIDKRADLYALGTIAYLMLGGKTPFTGELMQLVMQKVMQKPQPLASIRSDVPADVDRVIMRSLETDPNLRPASVAEWIVELEAASEDVSEGTRSTRSRLVILGPSGAEVYVDDERRGSVGSTGRVVLSDVPPGQHVLRVSLAGERDDERVIEIRADANEQVIQAQLRAKRGTSSQPSSSQGSSAGAMHSSVMPGIVACSNCQSRFAEGVRFCGRCGGGHFVPVSAGDPGAYPCPRCGNTLQPNSRFCGRCGLHMTASGVHSSMPPSYPSGLGGSGSSQMRPAGRTCARCGNTYPPNIRFCGRCGLTLA